MMPVQALTSLAGDTATPGGRTATAGQSVQLSLASYDGVSTTLWEIFGYPPDWPVPTGWTAGTGGVYYAASVASALPPAVTLPAATTWGKWLFRATVNSGLRDGRFDATLIDASAAVRVLGPYGLRGAAPRETNQFDANDHWAGEWQRDLRVLVGGISDAATATAAILGEQLLCSVDRLIDDSVPSGTPRNTILYTAPTLPAGNGRVQLTRFYVSVKALAANSGAGLNANLSMGKASGSGTLSGNGIVVYTLSSAVGDVYDTVGNTTDMPTASGNEGRLNAEQSIWASLVVNYGTPITTVGAITIEWFGRFIRRTG